MGSGHGIGLALAKAINAAAPEAQLVCTYRDQGKAQGLLDFANGNSLVNLVQMDPTSEEELEELSSKAAAIEGDLTMFINAVGFLHSDTVKPEKSLKQLDFHKLEHYFRINSFIAPMAAKYLFPLLKHGHESVFASLSAKVGSIDDNRIGGWYGYRSSKAALNMFLKNIAIEFQRYGIRSHVLAIHPGTTVTELSKPYIQKTKLKLHSPEQSAENILSVISSQPYQAQARFLSWDGTRINW